MAETSSLEIVDAVLHVELADGTPVCIRPIRASDEPRMREGIRQLSSQSRYLRFFSVQPMPPDRVIHSLADPDGHAHLAWGAIALQESGQPAIGAVHAVRSSCATRTAEFAIAILDAYHGLGLARMLSAVIFTHCLVEGISALEVQVLAENRPALSLVDALGGDARASELGVLEYEITPAEAIRRLEAGATPQLRNLLAALSRYR